MSNVYFEEAELKIVGSEPVMVCNETLTHHCGQNLLVLASLASICFGYNDQSLGEVAIEVEISETARLIPRLFHGA